MDTTRPTKTFADYMVIAISPVLIMLMVHSVCFFLAEVFYRGEAIGGVRWVLFWFVLAVVLIARIGIEQGPEHAMGYGGVLAFVVWIYLSTIQPNVVFGALLLAIVWFTAHKLTSNCTLVDDNDDASGQGLLQSIRRLPALFGKPPAATTAEKTAAVPLPSAKSPPKKKKASVEIPGVWLIYYSLAALPIFGLGQTLLPAGDMAARRAGFIYLFFYLAGALGLLVTTSFLGLRRYLRQRYLAMPGNIAFGWVQFGAIAALLVLCFSLLLPRPGAGQAWGSLRYHIDYQLHRASEYAAKFNPHGTGSGRPGNQPPPSGQPESQPQSGQAPGQKPSDTSSPDNQGHQPGGKPSDQGNPSGSGGEQHSDQPMPNLSPAASSIYSLLKILFWIAAAVVLAWLIYRYRVMILTMLKSAWAAIRNFIDNLLALFRPSAAAQMAAAQKTNVPPFKTFKSPFLTGSDKVWPPEQLITYSYEALQSWVLENEAIHGSPKTPREFCRQLSEEMPEAADALEHLAFLYGHVAYGASIPGNYNPEHLRLLWHHMALPRAKQVVEELAERR